MALEYVVTKRVFGFDDTKTALESSPGFFEKVSSTVRGILFRHDGSSLYVSISCAAEILWLSEIPVSRSEKAGDRSSVHFVESDKS